MDEYERRDAARVDAKGLEAKISITEPNGSIFIVEVNLLDVSASGIKLRTQKPLLAEAGRKVQLEVILPKSGLPVIVEAEIVHTTFEPEFGLHYLNLRPEDPIEQLIKECGQRTHWGDNSE